MLNKNNLGIFIEPCICALFIVSAGLDKFLS